VEIDAGISIVPESTVTQEVAKQTLGVVDLEGSEFYRTLAAIYKKSKVLSPAMKQFIGILKGETTAEELPVKATARKRDH
jgi:DNA-binding transcriptional LysR family regulator